MSERPTQNELHALKMFAEGKKPAFSTGICESLTCGYGKLDDNGYWEFPLYPAEKYLPSNPSHAQEVEEQEVLKLAEECGAIDYFAVAADLHFLYVPTH